MPSSRPVHHPIGVETWADRRAASLVGQPSLRPRRFMADAAGGRPAPAASSGATIRCVERAGQGYAATVVDHRKPHRGDAALMYAWTNLEAMTKPCHDRKTAARDGGFGNPVRRTA